MSDVIAARSAGASLLRRPLNELEQTLLAAAWSSVPNRGFTASPGWRTRQTIDEELLAIPGVDERGLEKLYSGLPCLNPELPYGHGYGLIWYADMGMAPRPDAPILLTLAGLARLAELDGTSAAHARRTLELLLPAIADLGESKKKIPGLGNSDPTGTPLTRYMLPVLVATRDWVSPVPVAVVATIMRHEYGNPFSILEQADGWRIRIPESHVVGWRDIRDVQAYWGHLDEVVDDNAGAPAKQSFLAEAVGMTNHPVNNTTIYGGQNNIAVGTSGSVQQSFTTQEVHEPYRNIDAAVAQILERIDQLGLIPQDRELLAEQAQVIQEEVRSAQPNSKTMKLGIAAIHGLLNATGVGVKLAISADVQAWLAPLLKHLHL